LRRRSDRRRVGRRWSWRGEKMASDVLILESALSDISIKYQISNIKAAL
jgi:hypothetical protein